MRALTFITFFLITNCVGSQSVYDPITKGLLESEKFAEPCRKGNKTIETLSYCLGRYSKGLIDCKNDNPNAEQCNDLENSINCALDMMQRNWMEEGCRTKIITSIRNFEVLPGTDCKIVSYTAKCPSPKPDLEFKGRHRFDSGTPCIDSKKNLTCKDISTSPLELSDKCGPNFNQSSTVRSCNLISDFNETLPLPCLGPKTMKTLSSCLGAGLSTLSTCKNNTPDADQCKGLDSVIKCLLNQVELKEVEDECIPMIKRALTASEKFEGTDCSFLSYMTNCAKKPDLEFNGRYRFSKNGKCENGKRMEKCVDILTVPPKLTNECIGGSERTVDCTANKGTKLFELSAFLIGFIVLTTSWMFA